MKKQISKYVSFSVLLFLSFNLIPQDLDDQSNIQRNISDDIRKKVESIRKNVDDAWFVKNLPEIKQGFELLKRFVCMKEQLDFFRIEMRDKKTNLCRWDFQYRMVYTSISMSEIGLLAVLLESNKEDSSEKTFKLQNSINEIRETYYMSEKLLGEMETDYLHQERREKKRSDALNALMF